MGGGGVGVGREGEESLLGQMSRITRVHVLYIHIHLPSLQTRCTHMQINKNIQGR